MSIFQTLFYQPIFNLLIFFMQNLGSLGLAIVGIALLSRLILLPFTRKQLKDAKKNKQFQDEVAKIRKKYKKNKEKQAQEMAKIQAKYLPGQIGGCLNLIITLILLIQVRNVIIDLMDQGVHAFNKVSYSESLMIEEDFIRYELPNDLEPGVHQLEYTIVAEEGQQLTKRFDFAYLDDEQKREEIRTQLVEIRNRLTPEEQELVNREQRDSDMSVYIGEFEDVEEEGLVIITDPITLTAYIRPPSGQAINYADSQVRFDEQIIATEALVTNQGEEFNYTFLGANLAKVASDFDLTNIRQSGAYVLIAVSVGVTQFLVSKIQMGLNPTMASKTEAKKEDKDKDKKDKKKNKYKQKDEPEELDFTEIMAQTSRQMIYVFPFMTILLSMGYMGGATFFPSGVSLFWTGQNTFVIIQQLISNRNDVIEKFRAVRTKFSR